MNTGENLFAKYDIPAPRYTSYPTVPYWSDNPTTLEWLESVSRSLSRPNASFAMYIHIPFCESLCTFCGCNTSITKNHSVEEPYIDSLLKEFDMYIKNVPEISKVELKELHLGGGSPTYLTASNLDRLISEILSKLCVSNYPEFSIEVDPRRARKEQLEVLSRLQFSRISLGVQDFNLEVQKLINRNQTFEDTKKVTDIARELGYTSLNYDLVYGLPRQTRESISYTIEKTVELKPDRIAFYSYAHVPWIKASHRLFTEDDLPKSAAKRTLYETGRNIFSRNGYKEIGMDHFALPTDGLWKSSIEGRLHRNFMGYTENKTDLQLGLGVSAISDSWYAFHQNEKILKRYDKRVQANELPTLRGHKLNSEDLQQRAFILDLSTKWVVELSDNSVNRARKYLESMEQDQLIEWQGNRLAITDRGKPFLRNICMGLDFRLQDHVPETRVFSRAI